MIYKELETAFANYVGTDYAVSCNSGTSALTLALAGLGVGPGDEVIVPEFTMIACAWAVSYLGATPVFVDCGDDLNIDPKLIEKKITKKTKVIMAVHIYGRVCDMPAIRKIADKHKLKVLEDGAEAHGASQFGQMVGNLGDVAAFSFYSNKIVSAEEGGIVTTNDKELADRMRDLKCMSFGTRHDYYHEQMGFNFRMPDSQAKLALESLGRIDQELKYRKEKANSFRVLGMQELPRKEGDVYWVFDFFANSEEERDEIIEDNKDIARHFFKPMSMQPIYLGDYEKTKANEFSKRGLYFNLT